MLYDWLVDWQWEDRYVGIVFNRIVRLLFFCVCVCECVCVLHWILPVYSNMFKNKSLNCSTPFKHANRFLASTNNSKAFLRLKWHSRIGSLSRLSYIRWTIFLYLFLIVFFFVLFRSYSFFVSSFVHISVDIWCEYASMSSRMCAFNTQHLAHTYQLNGEQIFRILNSHIWQRIVVGDWRIHESKKQPSSKQSVMELKQKAKTKKINNDGQWLFFRIRDSKARNLRCDIQESKHHRKLNRIDVSLCMKFDKNNDCEAHAQMNYTFVDTPNQVFYINIMLLLNRVQHSSDTICKVQNE